MMRRLMMRPAMETVPRLGVVLKLGLDFVSIAVHDVLRSGVRIDVHFAQPVETATPDDFLFA